MELTEKKPLNRDTIKYIAVFTMLLNHIANVFLSPDSLIFEVLVDAGYFTAITMCYFLVEGYSHTRSKRLYGQRLLLFAFLSQIPFFLAFGYFSLNMMFTLFFCFLILVSLERIQDASRRKWAVAGLVFLTVFCDWAVFAAAFTILFAKNSGNREGLRRTYRISYLAFALSNTLNYLMITTPLPALLHGLCSGLGILASGYCILYLYNGRQAQRGRSFSKWFFYIFYPAHLLLLAGMQKFFF